MGQFAVVGRDGFEGERPHAARFVDMTGDDLFSEGVDHDLSHWMPSRTPVDMRADTSTEICMNWVAAHPDDDGVAVNGHADTDGALSIFVMVEPELALEHRALIVSVAEMGDFGFGGDRDVALLYGDLRTLLAEVREQLPIRQTFERANSFLIDWLSGRAEASPPARAAADALARSQAMAAEHREELGPRIVGLIASPGDDGYLIGFDEGLPRRPCLSPQARNTLDKERLHVVAQPDGQRWRYAVCYPQYLPWDTETLWRPPGWTYSGDRLEWDYTGSALSEVADGGEWMLTARVAPWTGGFPAFLRTREPIADRPEVVFSKLATMLAPELAA